MNFDYAAALANSNRNVRASWGNVGHSSQEEGAQVSRDRAFADVKPLVELSDVPEVKIVEPVEEVWYAHVLISETRNARGGWDLRTQSYATFDLALEAAMEKALVAGSGAVFCDAITIGRTNVAEVNSELDVTFVNDYANPERAHLVKEEETLASAPETPVTDGVFEDCGDAQQIIRDGAELTELADGKLVIVHGYMTYGQSHEYAGVWVRVEDEDGDIYDLPESEWTVDLATHHDQVYIRELRKSFNLIAA